MKSIRHHMLVTLLTLSGHIVLAADDIDHAAHHGDVAMPSTTSPLAATSHNADSDFMTKMDAQMKAMGAMHNAMMNAKSPKQRKAMMAEHMKTMQESAKMMGSMGDMGAKGGMPKMKDKMAAELTQHHPMMEKRMAMMEMMMQMVMDRLPAE